MGRKESNQTNKQHMTIAVDWDVKNQMNKQNNIKWNQLIFAVLEK